MNEFCLNKGSQQCCASERSPTTGPRSPVLPARAAVHRRAETEHVAAAPRPAQSLLSRSHPRLGHQVAAVDSGAQQRGPSQFGRSLSHYVDAFH